MDKHKFLPKARLTNRQQEVVDLAQGKRTLHIGMGGFIDDDQFTQGYVNQDLIQTLHGRLSKSASQLTGIDINPMTIQAFSQAVPGQYLVADIMDPSLPRQLSDRFDLILFLDVIEHLDDFKTALNNVTALLAPGGQIVISTCNTYCFDSFAKMWCNYESTHTEHTAYFSYLTLKRLFEMNGLTIRSFMYTIQDRCGYSSFFDWVSFTLNKIVCRIAPQFAPGLLMVVEPVATGTAVELASYGHHTESAAV